MFFYVVPMLNNSRSWNQRFATLSLAGGVAISGLGGCTSMTRSVAPDTCVGVEALSISGPFLAATKADGYLDRACTKGTSLAMGALIGRSSNGEINPVVAQATTRQIAAFEKKINAGENPEFYMAIIQYFGMTLQKYGVNYAAIVRAANPESPCKPDPQNPRILLCKSQAPASAASAASAPTP